MSAQKDFRLGNSLSRNETFNIKYIQEFFVLSYQFCRIIRLHLNTLQRTVAIAALARRRLVEVKQRSRFSGTAGVIGLRSQLPPSLFELQAMLFKLRRTSRPDKTAGQDIPIKRKGNLADLSRRGLDEGRKFDRAPSSAVACYGGWKGG